MKSVGIIAEYNPFHNGHLYHLNQVKKLFPSSVIILILGGNFTQRGDVSILDKKRKTKIALEFGIDIVVELPFPFATASSDIFAEGAITLCHHLGVTDLVFGSETGDIEGFKKLSLIQLENPNFDSLVQVHLRMGENYPTALSCALKDLTGKTYTLPNDILGLSYVKAIQKFHYSIQPHTIKRTNEYHHLQLEENISSASSIRHALKKNISIAGQVPSLVEEYLSKSYPTIDDYFSFLQYKILTEENLEQYPYMDCGMKRKFKKEILKASSFDEFIHLVKSKNITYNKISRILLYIMCGYTKEKKEKYQKISYIRLLGFSQKGQNYLHKKKKDFTIPVISKFKREQDPLLSFEYDITKIYTLPFDTKKRNEFLRQEYQCFPIKKENEELASTKKRSIS